ncbi:MAG TPA: radical SAM protein [Longimicrobiales bacterium]|nr:radical SAM protein [Longimicrobiales bacterium]
MPAQPLAATGPSDPVLSTLSRLVASRPPRTTWQVKASTLCNLRCRYCYEWDRLADRRRMTLAQWRHVLEAVREHRRLRRAETGGPVVTTVVWHGGEPLLHPPGYAREVLALQREVLTDGTPPAGAVRNGVQTNLTRMGETLEVLIDAGFFFSVSTDFAGGARLDGAGCDVGAGVEANLRDLLRRGVPVGVAVVLGRHNRHRLAAIHDRVERLGARWLRVNPMLPPPRGVPDDGLHLSAVESRKALEGLFDHWIARGVRLPVQPLARALRTALRRRMGLPAPARPRDDVRFVVHPDGTVAVQGGTAEPTHRLGNLFERPIHELLDSEGARGAHQSAQRLRARHCVRCDHVDACDGRPVLDHPGVLPEGPCPIDSRLCARADRFLDAVGIQGTTSRNIPTRSGPTPTPPWRSRP